MVEDRPTAGFVLSLVAGIFILLNGIVIVIISGIFAFFGEEWVVALAALGLIFGIVVLLGAFMMYTRPDQNTIWGTIVLVFSLTSIVIGGGFILGLILGLIGGILAIVWKPEYAVMGAYRMCLGCGNQIPSNYAVCPHCGRPAAPAPGYPMQPVSPQAPPPMQAPPPQAPPATRFCSNCGAGLPPGANACPNCGAKVQ